MDFKLLLLSVVCFAFFVQPAQSGNIPYIILDTMRDIATAGTRAVQGQVAAAIKGGTDIGSIIATGIGLNIRALAQASGSMAGAGADGFIAVGDSISRAGNAMARDLTGRMLVETPVVQEVVKNVKVAPPTFVEEDIVTPYEQEALVESVPVRTVQLKVRRPATVIEARIPGGNKMSAVWNMLRDGGLSKVNGVRIPLAYEIMGRKIEKGPMYETIQIQKQ